MSAKRAKVRERGGPRAKGWGRPCPTPAKVGQAGEGKGRLDNETQYQLEMGGVDLPFHFTAVRLSFAFLLVALSPLRHPARPKARRAGARKGLSEERGLDIESGYARRAMRSVLKG